jgi:hypothetical protein
MSFTRASSLAVVAHPIALLPLKTLGILSAAPRALPAGRRSRHAGSARQAHGVREGPATNFQKPLALALLLLGTSASADTARAYCAIPDLTRGVPTPVEVESLEEGLCGLVRIGRRYVSLLRDGAELAKGPAACDAGGCRQRVVFFLPGHDGPYVVILHAPAKPG